MIYRAVLAVVLATALLGVALPPLDDARADRATAVVADQVAEIERVGTTLVATDDPVGDSGARRLVSFRIPARHWTSAGVDRVTIRPTDADAPASVSWRVRGVESNKRVLPGLAVATDDGEPLVLREAGQQQLVLALDGEPGSPVVTIRQLK